VTPFHDLQDYMAIPRVEALRLSPDGRRLVAVVKALSPDGKKYATALWEIDPGGEAGPRRLTRSVPGEANPAFLPGGTLLFVSERADVQVAPDDQDRPAIWALPASGGEAARIAARAGKIAGLTVAADAGTIAFTAGTLPGDASADGERRKKRADAGITAILHEDYPVRHWDHELGPDQPRLFILRPDARDPAGPACPDPRDVAPQAGQALVEQPAALTPDGSTAITGWWVTTEEAAQRSELAAIDLATGRRRTLLARDDTDFVAPVAAPDGRAVVCAGQVHGTTDRAPYQRLWLVPLDQAPPRELLTGLDLWPEHPAWSPDSARIYFTADQNGRGPVFVLDVPAGSVEQLTHDDASYSDLAVCPDGSTVYALRSGIDAPPGPVRIDVSTGDVTRLQAPGDSLSLPGEVTEITAAAPDGAMIRGWLVRPTGAPGPAPLLLWVHGGPYASWNAWSWRWNPWVMAARGYAVLLPDPALSTGYGQTHIRRGYGRWGEATFDDLMAIIDAALARPDIDATKTAMMGGSFGGYMANWIAGHTDRFSAVVTHASLWKLEGMLTSDESYWFVREFGDPAERPDLWEANDPARHLAKIRTPMLVIHGDRDYRVPIDQALWLWRDLVRNEVDAKFLYYPDENHWVLGPGNAAVWYETVLAFLAQHVLGEPWRRPAGV
jgi:dipeptidyl aminopeptidase/acylaminoacyl peptidase